MDAAGPACERHVRTIVDHDLSSRPFADAEQIDHEAGKLRRLEVPLADLNHVDA